MKFWTPSSIAFFLALCSHGAVGEGEDFMVELADEVLANKQRSLPIPWEIVQYKDSREVGYIGAPTFRDVGYMGEHPIGAWAQMKVQVGSLQTVREVQGFPPHVLIGRALGKEDNLPVEVKEDFRYTGVGGGDEIRHLNGMKNPDSATTMWGWQRQKWSTVVPWLEYWADRGDPTKLAVLHTSGNVLYGGCDENTLIYKYNQIIAANGVTGSGKVVVGAELSPYPEDLGWTYEMAPWTAGRMTDTLSAMSVPAGWVSTYADCSNRTLGPCTSPPTYKFANSGVIMGEVGALREMVADLGGWVFNDLENRGITDYYLKNPDKVAVDYSGSLSLSLHNMKATNLPVEVATSGGKKILKSKQSNAAVCFVVGNGNSFPALKTLAAELKA